MPTPLLITDTVVRDALLSAVQNVCRTMVRSEAILGPCHPEQSGAPGLISSVGFGGAVSGVVYLCLEDTFAVHATGRILGLTAPEVRLHGFEVIKDAIGEVTNMIAGGFKNKLCDLGLPCVLTLPTLMRGQHLSVVTLKGTEHHVFNFEIDGHRLIVEVQLKSD
jgi:chemotaxis protein CheX